MAARLQPRAPQPPYLQGLIARAQNRPDEAIAAFRTRAADRSPRRRHQRQPRPGLPAAAPLHRCDRAVARGPRGRALQRHRDVQPGARARPVPARPTEGQQAMERFQSLRTTGYGTTFSNTYLEQGQYAEAVASDRRRTGSRRSRLSRRDVLGDAAGRHRAAQRQRDRIAVRPSLRARRSVARWHPRHRGRARRWVDARRHRRRRRSRSDRGLRRRPAPVAERRRHVHRRDEQLGTRRCSAGRRRRRLHRRRLRQRRPARHLRPALRRQQPVPQRGRRPFFGRDRPQRDPALSVSALVGRAGRRRSRRRSGSGHRRRG